MQMLLEKKRTETVLVLTKLYSIVPHQAAVAQLGHFRLPPFAADPLLFLRSTNTKDLFEN